MEPEASKTALRDHLANERTFLAWTRTALGWAALGLLVDRVDQSIAQDQFRWLPGGLVVLTACLFQAIGLWRYVRTDREIALPGRHPSLTWAFVTTGMVAIATFGLAALLHIL